MFCEISSILIENNAVATAHYHQAITKLVQLAGGNEREAFDGAKNICRACLEECRRSARKLYEHRADHGC